MAFFYFVGISLPHVLPSPFLFCAELFPTSVRTVGLGISWNIGVCAFGGFGCVLAQMSLSLSRFGPGYMISIGGGVSTVAVLMALLLQRRGVMQLTHLRATPYWGRATPQSAEQLKILSPSLGKHCVLKAMATEEVVSAIEEVAPEDKARLVLPMSPVLLGHVISRDEVTEV